MSDNVSSLRQPADAAGIAALTRALAGLIVAALNLEVQATDTATFVATAAILLGVAVLASLVPALRILRLDPAQTLREDTA